MGHGDDQFEVTYDRASPGRKVKAETGNTPGSQRGRRVEERPPGGTSQAGRGNVSSGNAAVRSERVRWEPRSDRQTEYALMADRAEHWNQIFASKVDKELGWYEGDVRQTLAALERIPSATCQTVFVPGAGTSLLVDELLARGTRLILNDISGEALARLQGRIGARGDQIQWLHHDISQPLPDSAIQADIWIDRAVLHFLLAESEIDGYFGNVRTVVKPGGHVLLAEFSETGALRCAGLDVHRYSAEEMRGRLGGEFSLVWAEDYTFVNPAGAPRPYVYALFRRN